MIYKLGSSHYNNMADKNGGMYEYELIKKALYGKLQGETLVIVGGAMSSQDEVYIKSIFDNYKKKVFIVTDSVVFSRCLPLMNVCDVVLHQAEANLPMITTKQGYSFVPELFYTEVEKVQRRQPKVLFGGNNLGRQDLFQRYLFDNEGNTLPNVIAYYKSYSDDGQVIADVRIEYDKFMELMSFYKYSLVISRKEYRDLGWVTPRYVEAICRGNYPIVDIEYDKYNHFKYNEKVRNYQSMMYMVKYYEICSTDRDGYISEMQSKLKKDSNKFANIILNL